MYVTIKLCTKKNLGSFITPMFFSLLKCLSILLVAKLLTNTEQSNSIILQESILVLNTS